MVRLLIVVLSIFLIAPPLTFASGDAEAGKALFAKQCATCHGANGEGKDALAKMLKVTIRPLGSREVQAKSDAELVKDILEGTGKMKPVKASQQDAVNIVAFLRTLAK